MRLEGSIPDGATKAAFNPLSLMSITKATIRMEATQDSLYLHFISSCLSFEGKWSPTEASGRSRHGKYGEPLTATASSDIKRYDPRMNGRNQESKDPIVIINDSECTRS